MIPAALLITALMFGGTVLYSFAFAPFVVTALPSGTSGPLIRRAFPHFYVFVIATSGIAAGIAALFDVRSSVILAIIAVTTVISRQIVMPAVNAATDAGAKTRFKVLHSVSVLITLSHIGAAGYVIVRLASL
ncbi:MAG: DUF4149 domain-containing protein [Pseudomonadota bacterium]